MADDLVARLARVAVADLCDQFDRRTLVAPVLSRALKPLAGAVRFAGPALTVKGERRPGAQWLPITAERDTLYDSLDERVAAGQVVLFDCGGYDETAVFGDGTGLGLRMRGAAGVIVDGAVRDVSDLLRMELPVLARAVSPIRFVGRFRLVAIDVPVTLAGLCGPVTVNPGDLVAADADGAIVLPKDLAAEIIADAETAAATAAKIAADVARGVPRNAAVQRHKRS
jgi:4-hydroxy-4-methyl-2-oxoglutarate aldolase